MTRLNTDFSLLDARNERVVNHTILDKYKDLFDERLRQLINERYRKVPTGVFIESYETTAFEAKLDPGGGVETPADEGVVTRQGRSPRGGGRLPLKVEAFRVAGKPAAVIKRESKGGVSQSPELGRWFPILLPQIFNDMFRILCVPKVRKYTLISKDTLYKIPCLFA